MARTGFQTGAFCALGISCRFWNSLGAKEMNHPMQPNATAYVEGRPTMVVHNRFRVNLDRGGWSILGLDRQGLGVEIRFLEVRDLLFRFFRGVKVDVIDQPLAV